MAYKIIRFYAPHVKKANRTIETGLSLEEAQEHCQSDDTRCSEYFDGYEED